MAKKVSKVFKAHLTKADIKGAAWSAVTQTFFVMADGELAIDEESYSAWSNASAGKRAIKEEVIKSTPRKSVKMVAGENLDAKGKPLSFYGELSYKAEA